MALLAALLLSGKPALFAAGLDFDLSGRVGAPDELSDVRRKIAFFQANQARKSARQGAVFDPAGFDRAVDATFKIDGCSAGFVSPEGYFLTALHCLQACLLEAKRIQPFLERFGGGAITGWRATDRKATLDCSNLLMMPGTARVVFTGNYFPSSGGQLTGAAIEELMVVLVNSIAIEDFAVLKFDPPGGAARLPCLPLATGRPAAGASVAAIGYPGMTSRPAGFNSNGQSKFASFGWVLAASAPIFNRSPLSAGFLQAVLARGNVLHANVDIVLGNSGGPLVDTQGRIVGLNVAVLEALSTGWENLIMRVELPNNTQAIEAGYIRSRVAEELGEDRAAEIFSCPQ